MGNILCNMHIYCINTPKNVEILYLDPDHSMPMDDKVCYGTVGHGWGTDYMEWVLPDHIYMMYRKSVRHETEPPT